MPCMLGLTWWLLFMRQERTSASNSPRSDRRKACAPPSNGGAISSRNTRTDVAEDEAIRELSRKSPSPRSERATALQLRVGVAIAAILHPEAVPDPAQRH